MRSSQRSNPNNAERQHMSTPRISYVPLERMDEKMQEEMYRCAREGTPRPESSAVRAHAPNAFWAFSDSWKAIFHTGDRPLDQGAVPGLHLEDGQVRVLRQPAVHQGHDRRADRAAVRRAAQLRDVDDCLLYTS